MERRRRALGLKNLDCNKKEITKEPKSTVENSSREKSVKEVREPPSHQAGNVTPQRKDAVRLSTESPNSPALQALLPRTLGSPEVEVSWDWGCSQVPKEMLPKRRAKCVTQPLPVAVTLNPAFYPRVPLERKMSEEENQERLAFYKHVLSNSLRRASDDSANNNLDKEALPETTPTIVTPKRPSRSRMSSTKKEEINAFFDDSANEFMLECSQAVEEQLKNGLIDMGPIVQVTIPSLKHGHSPDLEADHNHKKVCHGKTKLNLFPEECDDAISSVRGSSSEKRRLSLKSPKNKLLNKCGTLSAKPTSGHDSDFENDDILSMMPTQVNPKSTQRITSTNYESSSINGEEQHKVVQCANITKSNASCDTKCTLPQVNQNCNPVSYVNRIPSLTKPPLPFSSNPVTNGKNNVPLARNPSGNSIQSITNGYDRVAKFRKVQNGNPVNSVNQNVTKPQTGFSTVINRENTGTNPVLKQSSTVNQTRDTTSGQKNSMNSRQGSRSNTTDFTSLLDDGFDMELSSLDFDSLCCNSESQDPPAQPPTKPTSKLCSDQEIEAKRLAALNRLKMRRKR